MKLIKIIVCAEGENSFRLRDSAILFGGITLKAAKQLLTQTEDDQCHF